jgi:DNA-binding CsgD family transcriptional regulator
MKLTRREREIFYWLSKGRSNRNIAENLFISPKTVANHNYNIRRKLDMKHRSELLSFAIRIACREGRFSNPNRGFFY